ncbi:MAG: type II toxin-antitoxin system Phd/YefM family antitoxin [Lachnospiraceae bacterium]|nr:type II toxin-antitoxin system Phd/YefM family antitoxin [Lachnospiraceae bacterium]
MTATVATELKSNFKFYMDKVLSGEQVIITRPKQKNVVLISEEEYNDLLSAKKRDQAKALKRLLSELKKAEAEADRDGWIPFEEVEKMLGV